MGRWGWVGGTDLNKVAGACLCEVTENDLEGAEPGAEYPKNREQQGLRKC